ncbi:TIGR03617 family F420-dependent LLM class oxidoreductase [Nocardia gamkensis]|uniref:TIGR03617 family F420-dependent LLM class oxidoreductase n=1 Tax=Nocardia gamkensis TaxID=352869 RepID=UPI0036E8D46A
MKSDVSLTGGLSSPDEAVQAEQFGYDTAWMPEIRHDPFCSLALAASRTDRIKLGTAVSVAFARSPMVLATLANDLQLYSEGRFRLGIGSQIKAHITRRFSMPWSAPADRMREYILAMRAIWHAWSTGDRLDFDGEYYTHTLMTPFFDPGPNPWGPPQVVLAGVGTRMTRVAGMVADGFFVHGFTTERYLREVTLPALHDGMLEAGRADTEAFEVLGAPFVVTGMDENAMEECAQVVRKRIAFYGSTPAYRPVLSLHGWDDLGAELTALSKQGDWDQMTASITDEVLNAFAVVAPPDELPELIRHRFADVLTSCRLQQPTSMNNEQWQPVLAALHDAVPSSDRVHS